MTSQPLTKPQEIKAKFDARFGRGWQSAMASILKIGPDTMSNFTAKTAHSCDLFFKLLEVLPQHKWPEDFSPLMELEARKKASNEKAAT